MDTFDSFLDFVISRWKDKRTITDEEQTREYVAMMVSLLANYRFRCLISTLIEVDDLMEEFDKIIDEEEKKKKRRRQR